MATIDDLPTELHDNIAHHMRTFFILRGISVGWELLKTPRPLAAIIASPKEAMELVLATCRFEFEGLSRDKAVPPTLALEYSSKLDADTDFLHTNDQGGEGENLDVGGLSELFHIKNGIMGSRYRYSRFQGIVPSITPRQQMQAPPDIRAKYYEFFSIQLDPEIEQSTHTHDLILADLHNHAPFQALNTLNGSSPGSFSRRRKIGLYRDESTSSTHSQIIVQSEVNMKEMYLVYRAFPQQVYKEQIVALLSSSERAARLCVYLVKRDLRKETTRTRWVEKESIIEKVEELIKERYQALLSPSLASSRGDQEGFMDIDVNGRDGGGGGGGGGWIKTCEANVLQAIELIDRDPVDDGLGGWFSGKLACSYQYRVSKCHLSQRPEFDKLAARMKMP